MLSTEEQRILRQIEHGLRRDDRRFCWRLTALRLRDLHHRRSARICLVIELAFLALAAAGMVYALPALTILGAGLGVLLPMVALMLWLPPPDFPDGPPTPPPAFWYW